MISNGNSAQFYADQAFTDLNNLQRLKQLGKEDQDQALHEVAKQFEGIFLQMMLKSMRQAGDVLSEDSLFNSNEMKFHRDMLDQQLSVSLTQGKGVGLAEALERQLKRQLNDKQGGEVDPKVMAEQPLQRLAFALSQTKNGSEGGDNKASTSLAAMQRAANEYQTNQPTKAPAQPTATAGRNSEQPSTPEQFIQRLLPHAKAAAEKLGIDFKVLLAQSALETGWGQAAEHNNLFGIKADGRWKGEAALQSTQEYIGGMATRLQDNFRAYPSYGDSVADYTDFIQSSPRYGRALQQSDAEAYIRELQQSGYATDPRYADKVMRVYHSDTMKLALASAGEGQS